MIAILELIHKELSPLTRVLTPDRECLHANGVRHSFRHLTLWRTMTDVWIWARLRSWTSATLVSVLVYHNHSVCYFQAPEGSEVHPGADDAELAGKFWHIIVSGLKILSTHVPISYFLCNFWFAVFCCASICVHCFPSHVTQWWSVFYQRDIGSVASRWPLQLHVC